MHFLGIVGLNVTVSTAAAHALDSLTERGLKLVLAGGANHVASKVLCSSIPAFTRKRMVSLAHSNTENIAFLLDKEIKQLARNSDPYEFVLLVSGKAFEEHILQSDRLTSSFLLIEQFSSCLYLYESSLGQRLQLACFLGRQIGSPRTCC